MLGELSSIDVGSSASISYGATVDKDYARLLRPINVTSYSQLTSFHRCPRQFQLLKQQADTRSGPEVQLENLDFAFGHAVGAGAQSWLVHKNLDVALFNSFMSWRADFDSRDDKGMKSIWEASLAVEKFCAFAAEALDDWDVFILPSGKPAIEMSFSIHAENGFKHYGHVDAVLRNRRSGKIAVGEFKTSKFKEAEEAFYANSSQAIGYSVPLESLFPGLVDYEVLYCVYSSTSREWQLLPFEKSVRQKIEWVKDLMLDHTLISTYERLKFFPKRGESCYDFRRRCQFFGECNIVSSEPFPRLPVDAEAEQVDYVIDIHDIIDQQKEMVTK